MRKFLQSYAQKLATRVLEEGRSQVTDPCLVANVKLSIVSFHVWKVSLVIQKVMSQIVTLSLIQNKIENQGFPDFFAS